LVYRWWKFSSPSYLLSYPKMDLSIISIRPPAEEGQGEGSEKKWTEARDWVSRKLVKTSNRKYRASEKQKLDAIVAGANKRLASRFYQLKTGHCLTGQYLQWTNARTRNAGGAIQTREHLFKNRHPVAVPAENPLGSRPGGDQEAPRPHSGAGPHQNCGAARR